MSIDAVSTFESSLAELDVTLTRTDPDGVADALADAVDEPAVGTPLGFDGVSLAETPVETDLTPRRIREAETGVTPVGRAVAEYGTLVVESNAAGNELVSLYPPTHVGVVRESDVEADVESTVPYLADRFDGGGSAVFATGVSSTGDMGALVEGVHGPRTVRVILVEGL
ncbi:LUD domain-containing protein [Halopelagius fulvigenes]|uniref:LUD domain-containing protein n=1 Tax=Halopelagius fulvigenes TaxID=1198324 RepID=A0ABD5TWQ3_9EURY